VRQAIVEHVTVVTVSVERVSFSFTVVLLVQGGKDSTKRVNLYVPLHPSLQWVSSRCIPSSVILDLDERDKSSSANSIGTLVSNKIFSPTINASNDSFGSFPMKISFCLLSDWAERRVLLVAIHRSTHIRRVFLDFDCRLLFTSSDTARHLRRAEHISRTLGGIETSRRHDDIFDEQRQWQSTIEQIDVCAVLVVTRSLS
jgi:hypothetical protein